MKKLIYTAIFVFTLVESFATRFASIHPSNKSNYEFVESPGDSLFTKASQTELNQPFETKMANGRLQIILKPGAKTGLVVLHDILGNKIFEASATEDIEWSLSGLKSGIYILIWKENRKNLTRRIVYRQEN